MISAGFVDTFRALYPDMTGAYSWWSNFFQSRARNIGWRIDYVMISKSLEPKLEASFIRPEVHGSDHCPVGITMDGQ
jgi:exodeoxyribonuclease-3